MENQKLSVVEKVGFGAGDMAVNVMVAALFYFMSFFYTDIYGLDPVDMGILFLVARFVDAFTDPLMGVITDKVKTRWGQFRHWFLFLSVPYGISIVLLFTTPDFDYNMKLVWAYLTYLFATLMFTGVAIPYISYIGVLTADPKERLSANGFRMFFAKIANVIIVFSVPLLASMWGGGDIAHGYKLAMILVSTCGVALFLFCFFTTRERITHEPQTESILTQFKVLIKNDQWLLLCAACVLGTLGYAIRGSVAMYYAKYYLGAPDLAGTFTSAGIAASIVSMVASTWITQRYCKLKLFRWSQIAVLFISLIMFFAVQPGDIWLAFVLYIILSFVVDLHAPVFWSAIAEAVDYGEIKDGVRASGLSFGGISFCQKAGGGLAGLAGGLLLAFFDYQPNIEQSQFTMTGLALMLTIIPGVFHAILGFVLFKYKITDNYYTDMVKNQRLPE
ncbi:MAG: GPH family glycoside/pentoside/hexuronide:cation symporter [Pseudoalteromonas rhizosphaerae]|jgi:GPH family glycoside/pentoside/hexuronide:cation symporter|uniref:MFS transporter n=2 Tax=Pseudoalteromonas TaxID=53246 RepID=A0ABY3FH46_9GAMM|nr:MULTISPECIES: MFS transporter [Pseudoalteromonas]MBB1291282.1 MFS transporter [Pseudoalteromonas sp. SR41-4]MBB1300246.1 MFS transporter [Pseudoalteromonas sp. SR44-8]TVU85376.1 MFS transporter [Pseudoalteromonas neustonica]|tara:strand:- start:33132 stop:34469 length:1338 start_codon:yes stop_codon:yes gene_type:complete